MVVDTEVTGKKLLQKGELKRRYTIIPLNKISARAIDDATVKRAQQLVSVPRGFLFRYRPGPLTIRQQLGTRAIDDTTAAWYQGH